MSDCLNVIALISGGKDSLYSLLHCIQNGHRVVALANLYPQLAVPSRSPNNYNQSIQSYDIPIDHGYNHLGVQPAEIEGTDLNSFMYQTVGHSLIPLYSRALQLPLFRRCITGTSIQKSQYYNTPLSEDGSDAGHSLDETEDLLPLLRQVIDAHPEANAVTTGAILSTYQRTRVESIAIRLGLTPLSYLWQYPVLPPPAKGLTSTPQTNKHRSDSLTGLLQDIAVAGIDARIIKIASAGISEKLLFANVADSRTQSQLVDGLLPFFNDDDEVGLRGAVVGEGGEYETITLSGPTEVWKGGRIQIDESQNQSYTEGGVHYIKLGKAKIVPHDDTYLAIPGRGSVKSDLILVPGSLDWQFEQVKVQLQLANLQAINGTPSNHNIPITGRSSHQISDDESGVEALSTGESEAPPANRCSQDVNTADIRERKPAVYSMCCTITPQTLTINNITATSILKYLSSTHQSEFVPTSYEHTRDSSTAEIQMSTILNHLLTVFKHLSDTCLDSSLSAANISAATLLLGSMTDFASVNPVYSQIYPYGFSNPPSRVTIAAPLPKGIQVSLSLVLDLCSSELRRGLHVQGRSYWAPANIGPYSQAVAVPLRALDLALKDEVCVEEESDVSTAVELEIVHIAGQIPLVPSSMNVHTGSSLDSAVLSLQHLWRVGQEREVDIWPWSVAYIAQTTENQLAHQVSVAAATWRMAHLKSTWSCGADSNEEPGEAAEEWLSDDDQESAIDIWDLQRNRSLYPGFRQTQMSVGKHLHVLPNHLLFHTSHSVRERFVPPFIAAEVNALPRGVSIEWWSNGIAGLARSTTSSHRAQLNWQTRSLPWGTISCLTLVPNPAKGNRSVKFVSYLVTATQQTRMLPVNLPQLLSTLDQSTSSTVSSAQLVQGIAFVSSLASQSGLWPQFVSNAEPDQPTHVSASSRIAFQTQLLGDSVSIIPCHSLHGSPTTKGQLPGEHHSELRNEVHDTKELTIAFLLRIETH